jgi:competence protein ComGC
MKEATMKNKAFITHETLIYLGIIIISVIIFMMIPTNINKVIDGCEYIQTYNGKIGGWTLIHKGNCTNKIHYAR